MSVSRDLSIPDILFPEDHDTIAMGIEYSLRQDGFHLRLANCLQAARDLLKGSPFDLVLLDLCLADGRGLELCKEIRSAGETPIIILSVRDEETGIVLWCGISASYTRDPTT